MKIMVVGDGHSNIHEVAVVQALKNLNHDVGFFYWHSYFKAKNAIARLWMRVQNKFLVGPGLNKLNKDLITKAIQFQPELIFIYRGTHITRETVLRLKNALPECELFGYNNDDPFSEGHPPWLWRHFTQCVPHYDLVFAYRHDNIDDFKKIGAKRVELLRSWFIKQVNYPALLSELDKSKYECDVVFIGHYEHDGRLEFLKEVVKAGYTLRLFGPPYGWDTALLDSEHLKHLWPVKPIWNEDYNKAICGAKVALCFFSKLNHDTYTRRCFEIPATKTMMLCEYSDDIASLYTEGVEADFFKTKEEMVEKLDLYLKNPKLREHVAESGYGRVIHDGHDIESRMIMVLEHAKKLGNNRK